MSPKYHRTEARRCRRLAAERPDTDSLKHSLIKRADDHDRLADIITELSKINAVLPRAPLFKPSVTLH
jgi:hypothetical protein